MRLAALCLVALMLVACTGVGAGTPTSAFDGLTTRASPDFVALTDAGTVVVVKTTAPSVATIDAGEDVDRASRVAVTGDRIYAESRGRVVRRASGAWSEVGPDQLLGANDDGVVAVHDAGAVRAIAADGSTVQRWPVDCDVTDAVWAANNTDIGVVCNDGTMIVLAGDGARSERSLPDRTWDITTWGDGFGIVVGSGDDRTLLRTPITGEIFGEIMQLPAGTRSAIGAVLDERIVVVTDDDALFLRDAGEWSRVATAVVSVGEVRSAR